MATAVDLACKSRTGMGYSTVADLSVTMYFSRVGSNVYRVGYVGVPPHD